MRLLGWREYLAIQIWERDKHLFQHPAPHSSTVSIPQMETCSISSICPGFSSPFPISVTIPKRYGQDIDCTSMGQKITSRATEFLRVLYCWPHFDHYNVCGASRWRFFTIGEEKSAAKNNIFELLQDGDCVRRHISRKRKQCL